MRSLVPKTDPPLYRCTLLDPPWLERGGGKVKRGADRHYPLLKTDEIIEVVRASPAWHPDPSGAHLHLWVTNNFLPDGLRVIAALGFRYVTKSTWVKAGRIGLGQYMRGLTEDLLHAASDEQSAAELQSRFTEDATEDLLFAVQGATMKPDTASRPTTLLGGKPLPRLVGPDGKAVHSGKPDEQYLHCEACSPGPRVELFARRPRPGWDSWGMLDGEAAGPVLQTG